MKLMLLTLAVFTLSITALHAQVLPGTVPDALAPDPALQQMVNDLLPHKLASYSAIIVIALMFAGRVLQARKNGLNWGDAFLTAFTGTNTPTKAPLIIGALCLLALPSCAGVMASLASPMTQAVVASAATLGKQLVQAEEQSAVAEVITKATASLAALQAQGASTDTAKEVTRQGEMAALSALITMAQQQYKGMTGAEYVIPVTPPAPATATPPPTVRAAN